MRFEFSKLLLVIDYLLLILLLLLTIVCSSKIDLTMIAVAWIAQCGISSTAYYWKAKNENRTKVPLNVVKSLPKNIREELDLTQIIISIITNDN